MTSLLDDAPPRELRLRYIDALRACAALLVVWLHVVQTYVKLVPGGRPAGVWLHDIAQRLDVGRIGVVVFFLISGFVIPFSMRPDGPAPIATFAIKRFFRIYPAYWLSVPVGAFATYWLWNQPFPAGALLVNLTLLQDLFGVPAAQGVYWTLLIELGFYALCVLLLLSGSLRDGTRIGALAALLAGGHAFVVCLIWLHVLPIASLQSVTFFALHLSLMLCGTLYRLCWFEGNAEADPRARRLMVGLLIFHIVIFPFCASLARGTAENYTVSNALGVIVFLLGTTVLRVESRLGDWLGKVSYSIYLFHLAVYYPLFWWLLHQPVGSWWRTQHLGVYLIVNIVATTVLASLVHVLVERPFIRYAHRLAERWAARNALPASGKLGTAAE